MKKKKIKITRCRNKYHWYSQLVGVELYVVEAKERCKHAIDGYVLAHSQIAAPGGGGFIYKKDTKIIK